MHALGWMSASADVSRTTHVKKREEVLLCELLSPKEMQSRLVLVSLSLSCRVAEVVKWESEVLKHTVVIGK